MSNRKMDALEKLSRDNTHEGRTAKRKLDELNAKTSPKEIQKAKGEVKSKVHSRWNNPEFPNQYEAHNPKKESVSEFILRNGYYKFRKNGFVFDTYYYEVSDNDSDNVETPVGLVTFLMRLHMSGKEFGMCYPINRSTGFGYTDGGQPIEKCYHDTEHDLNMWGNDSYCGFHYICEELYSLKSCEFTDCFKSWVHTLYKDFSIEFHLAYDGIEKYPSFYGIVKEMKRLYDYVHGVKELLPCVIYLGNENTGEICYG